MKLLASSRRVFFCSWISFVVALTACGGGGGSANSSAPTTPGTPSSGSFTFSSSSLDFGSVALGTPKTLTISMSNNGTAAVTVTQFQSTAGDFSLTGVTLPLTLNPQQSAGGTVTFNPSASGVISGNINAMSSGSSLGTLALRGTGLLAAAHSVSLSWTISSSPSVMSYNVYRSAVSGGPYAKVGNSATPSFTDVTVQAGKKYFYVVTSLDGSSVESAVSGEVSATVPAP